MNIVSCLKFNKVDQSEILEVVDNEARLNIIGAEGTKIYLHQMPFIQNHILYTQIGTCIYLGCYEEDLTCLYVIEQEVKNNKVVIKNIYSETFIDKHTVLAKFFRYDRQFQEENLRKRLLETIDSVKVIIDKEYLKGKILEYLDRNERVEDVKQLAEGSVIKEVEPKLKPHFIKKSSRNDNGGNNTVNKEVTVNGVTYKSQTAFRKAFGIPTGSFYDCLSRGMTLEEMADKYTNNKFDRRGRRPKEKIIVYGVEYRSQNDFCIKNDIPGSSVYKYITKGMTYEEILDLYKGGNPKGKEPVRYNYLGEEMSVRELSELSGLSEKLLWERLGKGWTVEKAVETPSNQ